MKRSGNHALSSWLLAQDEFVYFNNVLPMRPLLSGQMRLPPPMRVSSFLRWQLRKQRKRTHSLLPAIWAQLRLGDRPLLVGLEDHPPEQRIFRSDRGISNVLILRDIENMLASRIRKASRIDANPAYPREPGPLLDRVVANWKAPAREWLGETSVLPNKLCVDYALWVESQPYRRALSERLGLRFDDSGSARVSEIGGGSSFDGTSFDGANRAMRVFDRAAQLDASERALLERALDDVELPALSRAVAERRSELERRYCASSHA
jgi:hypothetical protein